MRRKHAVVLAEVLFVFAFLFVTSTCSPLLFLFRPSSPTEGDAEELGGAIVLGPATLEEMGGIDWVSSFSPRSLPSFLEARVGVDATEDVFE